jgi:VanZ family protein
VLWGALIATWSLLPTPPGAGAAVHVPGADLTLHVAAYAVLCLLACRSAPPGQAGARLAAAALVAFLFGLAIECLQPLTGRAFAARDLAANAGGVLCGVGMAWLLGRRRAARKPPGAG